MKISLKVCFLSIDLSHKLLSILLYIVVIVNILVACESPLYVHPHSKIILNQSINDDSEFLTSQLVMDYSLLVGLDEDSGELVLGIIGNLKFVRATLLISSWIIETFNLQTTFVLLHGTKK